MTSLETGAPCPVCGAGLRMKLARSKRTGKPSIALSCPVDGRHFRGFIADRDYVSKLLELLEAGQ